ncbi:MAG: hypothetical protein ACAH11_04130 [Sphingomonas sp.]
MSDPKTEWDGEIVRKWLESRFVASRSDQDVADRRGRQAEDDYDKAAAEEWVCRTIKGSAAVDDQARFGERLKALLDQDDYLRPGVHDERRFEREVRAYLRKLIKMTKANAGFGNLLRYQ